MSEHASAEELAARRFTQQRRAQAAFEKESALLVELTEKAGTSREARMDAHRRMQALRRAQHALVARSHAAIEDTLRLLPGLQPGAVVVHRNAWMREKVRSGFAELGVRVLAETEDGAEGLGIAIAEQPDIVLLEDKLPSMSALEVVGGVLEYVSQAVVAAQVEHDDEAGPLVEAGAAVFSRRVPPAELAAEIHALLLARGSELVG